MRSRFGLTAVLTTIFLVVGACASAPPPTTRPSPAPVNTPGATIAPSIALPTPSPLGFTPGTESAPRDVAIAADDELTYRPNVIVVVEGETVTFHISNAGQAQHEFMLGPEADAMADTEGTPEVADIAAGETKTLTFTFDGPGPYAFACHEPGHFEAGMLGYIVVVGPDVPKVGTKDNPRLVEVSMDDQLKFMPVAIGVSPGESVRFLLTNNGTATHEFAVGPKEMVDNDNVDGVHALEADEILSHSLKVLDYTFDGTGPYGFACHEPGHFEAGMKGDIVFTP
jgi:uncharacterized cupredoxin-like copper-binding protein